MLINKWVIWILNLALLYLLLDIRVFGRFWELGLSCWVIELLVLLDLTYEIKCNPLRLKLWPLGRDFDFNRPNVFLTLGVFHEWVLSRAWRGLIIIFDDFAISYYNIGFRLHFLLLLYKAVVKIPSTDPILGAHIPLKGNLWWLDRVVGWRPVQSGVDWHFGLRPTERLVIRSQASVGIVVCPERAIVFVLVLIVSKVEIALYSQLSDVKLIFLLNELRQNELFLCDFVLQESESFVDSVGLGITFLG